MTKLLAAVALGMWAATVGCQRDPVEPPVRPASALPAGTLTADTLIVLERYYTFNHRRAYLVRIEPGGVVRFDGRVPAPGTQERHGPGRIEADTLDAGATRRLVAAAEAAGFWAFPDTLLSSRPPCVPTRTDSGLARVALSVGNRTKQVFHELGCSAPQSTSVAALEVAIDRAAGTERWTGRAE